MKAAKLAALFSCSLLAFISIGQLRAVPNTIVTGSASFGGSRTASGVSGAGLTTVYFAPGWTFQDGTGTFAGIISQAASFTSSFSFTGDGNSVVLTRPITNFWSFTVGGSTYSFNLSGLTNGHVQSDAMAFSGTGTLFATGFNATPATLSINGRGPGDFTFQLSFVTNTATPTSTPDTGSTLLLTSFGLIGLLACRRRIDRQT
jgi:hypothetical protein